ncbi:M48 family metallopeptidase [Anaerostipes sp.]|uniref:M48 family metallopeptidase n=1 Tax=Anaerostipes sp. TaxID=1872530 RepID=UPI0025BDFBA9|nr:SprT family zinc-dependent metalloprotease [Anaerostipes sp.]MBS7007336.1 M48 family metallopeptidase [Anaerostipes sp.]
MERALAYEVVYSKRKTLAVTVACDGNVIVRAPRHFPESQIVRFINEKQSWIDVHIKKAKEREKYQKVFHITAEQREAYIQEARSVITRMCRQYAGQMGVSYNKISIREQKTRWGSASSKGNLNFNWKLILMPEDVLEYVVVHELSHLKVMNHSPVFYRVVARYLPNYKQPKKWLSDHGTEYKVNLIS